MGRRGWGETERDGTAEVGLGTLGGGDNSMGEEGGVTGRGRGRGRGLSQGLGSREVGLWDGLGLSSAVGTGISLGEG